MGFSLVVASKGYSLAVVQGLLIAVASCCRPWALGCAGFSHCSVQAQELRLKGSRVQILQLWCMGLVTPWSGGSSQIKDQTHVSCIGRQILYY